jgi:hypothetical protein
MGFSLQSITRSAWLILVVHEIGLRNDVVCEIFTECGPRDILGHAGEVAV